MSDGRDWRQLDIGFERSDAGGAVLVTLAAVLPGALARGDLGGCFFMQKPPGMRLRLAGSDAQVNAVAAALARPGLHIARGVYEPETYLFDGPAGLRAAHDAFTADTLAVCGYAAAAARGAAIAHPAGFSLALCAQVLDRLGLDAWETWDVWMRLLTLRGGIWQAVTPSDEDAAPASGCDALLADHALRIDRLALRLAGPARARTFPNGIRRILPFWIAFHWNRMGFDADTQAALAAAMAARLHPRARCEEAAMAWAR